MITAIGAVYITSNAGCPGIFSSLYRNMDKHISWSVKPATGNRYNAMIYPAVMPLDTRYQYEF